MAKLLSRAYESLNRVLSLAGNQIVNDVDLETAFPVHDLTPVVQAGRVEPIAYALALAVGAGATSQDNLDLEDPTAWDAIRRGDATNLTNAQAVWDRSEEDLIVTSVVANADVSDLDYLIFETIDTLAGPTKYFPFTTIIDGSFTGGGPIVPSAGANHWGGIYYVRRMPWRPGPWESLAARIKSTAVGFTAHYRVFGYVGPRGVFPYGV